MKHTEWKSLTKSISSSCLEQHVIATLLTNGGFHKWGYTPKVFFNRMLMEHNIKIILKSMTHGGTPVLRKPLQGILGGSLSCVGSGKPWYSHSSIIVLSSWIWVYMLFGFIWGFTTMIELWLGVYNWIFLTPGIHITSSHPRHDRRLALAQLVQCLDLKAIFAWEPNNGLFHGLLGWCCWFHSPWKRPFGSVKAPNS